MGLLAEWFVQISAKGTKETNKEIDQSKEKLDKAEKSASKFGSTVKNVFTVATVGIGAFVRAGLQGTIQGEALSLSFQQFAREVAGVFLPVIELLTGAIQFLTQWMQKLSGDGQVAVLALGAAIATAVAIATGGWSAIFSAIVLVIATIKEFLEQAGVWDGLIAKLKEVGEAILNFMLKPLQWAMQMVRQIAEFFGIAVSKGGQGRQRKEVTASGAEFNDASKFFKDLQLASVGHASIPARQLKVAEEQLTETRELNRNVGRLQPAVGR